MTHVTFWGILVLGLLGHGVESGTVLEPLNLGLVEGVREGDLESLTVGGLDTESDGLANSKLSAEDVDLVIGVDPVVVGGVGEGERKHTLLLEVGLMDTSERAGDDGETTKVAGLESGVLTRRTLTVVPITDNDPTDALGLVVTGNSGDGIPLTSGEVLDLVGLTVGSVDGTNQHVVGDVVEMTTVLEPRTGHGNVIGGGLALGLDEDRHVSGILAVPSVEGREELETVGGGGDLDSDVGTVLRGCLVGVLAGVVASLGETVAGGRRELEVLAILVLQGIGEGVEGERAGNGHGDDEIGGGDEGVSGGVTIVTAGEVTVVGRDDGVGFALLHVLAIPLTNAGAASVGKNDTTELLEGLELAITGNGGANLLGTGGDGEESLGFDAVVEGITGDGGGAGHILVRGVGARADKTDLDLIGPVVGLGSLGELGDGGSKIGSEGTVDMGLELREVDLDELVVLGTVILAELLGVRAGKVTDLGTLGGLEVVVHAVVEGEERGGGTNLSTHVADGTHTSGRQAVDTRAEVLNDGTSATLDGENASNLENDILGRSPARERASQLNTDNLGTMKMLALRTF